MYGQVMEIVGFTDLSAILRSGVYILIHRGVVIYIGKSKTMLGRVYTHKSMWGAKRRGKVPEWMTTRGIMFDEVHVRPCREDQLDQLESAMIDLYKPRYNTRLKSPGVTQQPITLNICGSIVRVNARPRPQIERRV